MTSSRVKAAVNKYVNDRLSVIRKNAGLDLQRAYDAYTDLLRYFTEKKYVSIVNAAADIYMPHERKSDFPQIVHDVLDIRFEDDEDSGFKDYDTLQNDTERRNYIAEQMNACIGLCCTNIDSYFKVIFMQAEHPTTQAWINARASILEKTGEMKQLFTTIKDSFLGMQKEMEVYGSADDMLKQALKSCDAWLTKIVAIESGFSNQKTTPATSSSAPGIRLR